MSDLMEAPAERLDDLGDAESGGNRSRLLMVVAGVGGLVVVGLAAWFLFFSGGGGVDPLSGTVPGATVPSAVPSDQASDGSTKVPPVAAGNLGRNPFQPLPAEAVVSAPATGTDSTGTLPTAPPVTGTDTGSTGSTGSTGGTGTGTGTGTTTSTSYRLTFFGVRADKAKFDVNGTSYTVAVKKMFPSTTQGPFQLLHLSQDPGSGKWVATIVFGSDTPENMGTGDAKTFTP